MCRSRYQQTSCAIVLHPVSSWGQPYSNDAVITTLALDVILPALALNQMLRTLQNWKRLEVCLRIASQSVSDNSDDDDDVYQWEMIEYSSPMTSLLGYCDPPSFYRLLVNVKVHTWSTEEKSENLWRNAFGPKVYSKCWVVYVGDMLSHSLLCQIKYSNLKLPDFYKNKAEDL